MLRVLPAVIEPEQWVLAFHRTSPHWWVRWLACGKYKHVSAFAWVDPLKLWLVFDVTLGGLRLLVLPDSTAATRWLADHTADADLLKIERKLCKSYAPLAPFYCVSAVKHLVGIRCGALRVDALWAFCERNGGVPLDGAGQTADRPGDREPAAAGAHR